MSSRMPGGAPAAAVFAWLAAVPPSPPLLLDPAGALIAAKESSAEAPLWAAEAQLLAGDPKVALATLAGAGATARRLRLEVDARVALQDRQALPLIEALAGHDGWEQHAARQRAAMEAKERRQQWVRLGSMLFALTLGLLILTGARELLALRIETAVVGIGAALVLALVSQLSKPLMAVAGVACMAGVALVHAGTAAVRRTAAPPRIRLMIAASMLLGFGGVCWAVGAQIGLGGILSLLALHH